MFVQKSLEHNMAIMKLSRYLFGLTNAPTTFMSLMNGIFHHYLGGFILILIDDILIYSKNAEEHKEHLRIVLQTLRENKLYAKFNNCNIFKQKIQYLWHVISSEGTEVDPKKIRTILD